ncbi:MAG: hypothetical protein HC883_06535 [Bdellovibrionaceae bacterium]|nr:hypothetical protein [Pseudobdellovibrionaceae bacterium]
MLAAHEYLAFKRFKLGDVDVIGWVSEASVSKDILWEMTVYCPGWWITVRGPGMDREKVTPELLAKFKKGDLALFEPYKRIYESVRCIPAKQAFK